MPAYINSPFQPPKFVMKGVATYLWGFYDYKIASTNLFVTQVALASNVGTVTATILNGPAPAVGQYISIIGTTTGSGEFNVNRAIITSATVNSATGVCSLSFALTGSNQTAVADTGTVIVEPNETPETLVAGASIACLIQAPEGDSQFTLTTEVTFPTLPTAATVSLQEGVVGPNSTPTFTTLGTAAVVAGGAETVGPVAQFSLTRGSLYRFLTSGITGSGTICAKVFC
jgi:hypothetical protein